MGLAKPREVVGEDGKDPVWAQCGGGREGARPGSGMAENHTYKTIFQLALNPKT